MRKFAIGVALYLFSVNVAVAQKDTGVHFVQTMSWSQVKDKAMAENKYIFVDCYASWCGPCKAMDTYTYPKEKVGDYLNEHFISLKVQMDTTKNDVDRIKEFYSDAHFLMQEYRISAFPYLLFFSPEGKLVHRQVGFKSDDDLISIAKDAMDPSRQYCTLVGKFESNNLDTSAMKDLARNANSLGDKDLAGKIANEYIDKLGNNQILQPENVLFMVEFTTSSKDRGFEVFKGHQEMTQPVNAKDLVENIIYKEEIKPNESGKAGKPDWARMHANLKKYGALGEDALVIYKPGILFKAEIAPALKKTPEWNKIFALIKKQNAGKGEEFLVGSSVVYYLNDGLLDPGSTKDYRNFLSAAKLYFKKYYSYLSASPLNTWAWNLFQRSMDKDDLKTALTWSDSCIKLSPQPNASYYDTYANLLYKTGRSKEALSWEEKAVSLAPDDKDIQDCYFKMKKGVPTWGKNN